MTDYRSISEVHLDRSQVLSRPPYAYDKPQRFGISALSASVFAFALALQGIASLVLSGCERMA
jgi:hypothetical protein